MPHPGPEPLPSIFTSSKGRLHRQGQRHSLLNRTPFLLLGGSGYYCCSNCLPAEALPTPIRWPLPQTGSSPTPHLPALTCASQCIAEKPQEKGHPHLSSVPFTARASSPFSGLSGSLLGPVAPGQHYALAPPLISVWSLLCPQEPPGPRVSVAPSYSSSSAPYTTAPSNSAGDSYSPWRTFTWLLGEERTSHSEESGKPLSWALMILSISNAPDDRDRTGKYGNEAGLTTS